MKLMTQEMCLHMEKTDLLLDFCIKGLISIFL